MPHEEGIQRVIDSAARLGIELDEQEARDWIAAMTAESAGGDIVIDVDSGVFGHRATMLDLDAADIAHFRRIGRIVGLPSRPGQVATALAMSGSAAQNRIHSYPADADFFERVHITAPTREAACAILADVIREKALATMTGPTYRLWEVKFGTWDADVIKDGRTLRAGSPMSWSPAEVAAGSMTVSHDGAVRTVGWEEAARDPGWCKIDWVVADPERGALANASNMLDPTWEAPDGTIVPLDGFLDPYFQEVYLDSASLPLFERIIRELSHDSVDEYVKQLETEVRKHATTDPNWGKVARRLYNIFRLTGHYPEAAYIRELFDEPTTVLYRVAALIRTIDEAASAGSPFAREELVEQCDQLIMSAIGALSGPSEAAVVAHLLKLRDQVGGQADGDRTESVSGVRDHTMSVVNEYFRERLIALPAIREYVEQLAGQAVASSAPAAGPPSGQAGQD
ncbi:MAG TPA: hypothetical protein VM305_09030 [Candidatus Limnocylindrales bacterium]|nr:hypothetical protein [Candidatus Limnocylindrales bacterium]